MNVTIVEITDFTIIAEYTLDDKVYRKIISRTLADNTKRGPATLPDEIVNFGIEYSNVDLPAALGEYVNEISIADLQNRLRKAGIWLRDDYRQRPAIVDTIVRQVRGKDRSLDTTTVFNAAFMEINYGQ